ncbi:MAG: hypothetical protein HY039_10645 [Nitrospirae bacterium]|nr:hypothetical protein [Nitrospirota bacterium]
MSFPWSENRGAKTGQAGPVGGRGRSGRLKTFVLLAALGAAGLGLFASGAVDVASLADRMAAASPKEGEGKAAASAPAGEADGGGGLTQRAEEIGRREAAVKREEEKLREFKKEMEQKIAQFEKLKIDVEASLKKVEDEREQNFRHLVKVYESMPAEDAAARMEKLEDKVALALLSRMKGKTAGKVLAAVEPTRAARLSESLAEKKKR